MAGNKTFSMIKPNSVSNGHIGQILAHITNGGFRIVALKMTKLSVSQAEAFYGVHKDRPFFNSLVDFMQSGPVVAMILEKDNAVDDFRKLIGATNPEMAEEGTVRKLYGESVEKNAVHGSDSDENAMLESNFFFSAREKYTQQGIESLTD